MQIETSETDCIPYSEKKNSILLSLSKFYRAYIYYNKIYIYGISIIYYDNRELHVIF